MANTLSFVDARFVAYSRQQRPSAAFAIIYSLETYCLRTVCTKWMMLDWEMMRLSWPVADTMGTRWTFGVDRATISSAWVLTKGPVAPQA